MRILGIDPGIERTGFAVMETNGGELELLDFGRIFTKKTDPFPARLKIIADDLRALIAEWKPAAAALEQVFFSKNVKSAMKVASARGVILEVFEEQAIPVREFNPSHIKIAVTGDGRADKIQIKKMLMHLLGIDLKHDDAADAIACGICLLQNIAAIKNTV